MNPALVIALVTALLGTGGVFSVVTAVRAKQPRELTLANAADKTVLMMSRALDAMERRALAAERERDEAVGKLAELEARFTAMQADLAAALDELRQFRLAQERNHHA